MEKHWLLRISHFAVDFACAFLCLSYAEDNIQFYLLIYNFCAFALQMPLGLLVDRFGRQIKVAATGILLTAVSLFFYNFPLPGVIIAGLGNALFHVGGGVYVLHGCGEKCKPLGSFVAPGAVGLFLGGWFAARWDYIHMLVAFVLLVLAFSLFFAKKEELDTKTVPSDVSMHLSGKSAIALVLLFLVVVLRSVAGFQFGFPWKTGVAAFLFTLAVAAGKYLGGLLSDRFGMTKTSLVSLLVGTVLFVFAKVNAVCGILAVLLFNFTMPVTLFAAYKILKTLPGFSFGLLTFALFLGLLPSYFGFSLPGYANVFGVGACIVSLALLLPGLKLLPTERESL